MCGTPNKCRAFFADAESGLVGRVTPVELPDMMGARMLLFKPWTKEEEERVKRECLCLMDEEGEVSLPLINQAIDEADRFLLGLGIDISAIIANASTFDRLDDLRDAYNTIIIPEYMAGLDAEAATL